MAGPHIVVGQLTDPIESREAWQPRHYVLPGSALCQIKHSQQHSVPGSLSLYAWPSTGRSALDADRSVAIFQASEPCARGDLLHPAFTWMTWLSSPGAVLSWALFPAATPKDLEQFA